MRIPRMIGKRIKNVERIVALATASKSIYHTQWKRTSSASWFLGMPLFLVSNYVRMGWLYEYAPNKKKHG